MVAIFCKTSGNLVLKNAQKVPKTPKRSQKRPKNAQNVPKTQYVHKYIYNFKIVCIISSAIFEKKAMLAMSAMFAIKWPCAMYGFEKCAMCHLMDWEK